MEYTFFDIRESHTIHVTFIPYGFLRSTVMKVSLSLSPSNIIINWSGLMSIYYIGETVPLKVHVTKGGKLHDPTNYAKIQIEKDTPPYDVSISFVDMVKDSQGVYSYNFATAGLDKGQYMCICKISDSIIDIEKKIISICIPIGIIVSTAIAIVICEPLSNFFKWIISWIQYVGTFTPPQ